MTKFRKLCHHRSKSVPSALLALSLLLPASAPVTAAETCDQNQISQAVDQAGEQLRNLTQQTQPILQAKLLRLKEVKGWSQQDYEEKGYAALADERTAKLDAAAGDLLARLDSLSGDNSTTTADCANLSEIESVSLELQATVRAKSSYVLSRADQLIGDKAASAPLPFPPTKPVETVKPPIVAAVPQPPASPPAPKPTPQAVQPKTDSRWATQTTAPTKSQPTPIPPPSAADAPLAPSPQVAIATSPPVTAPPTAEPEGYAIDEIVAAASGPFGKVSANLARVLEHAFAKSGRPSGYILGEETGGAFIAGLRYGSGRLYLRTGGTMPIYWHGPSLGADIGAQGSSILFLIYKVHQPEDVFSNFSGIEGSAFVVGGLGITYMSNGRIDMAPIRSGIGLRLGANLGYVRFTSKPTWNPF